ncbi:MAG: Competence protein [Parachlamydiales bacterium]|nr:Competence protein [Parachlamydiales bacterium]
MKNIHRAFWQEHPAMGFGISALLGALLFFYGAIVPAIIWILYLLFLFPAKALVHAFIICLIATQSYLLYSNRPSPGPGRAVFSIHSVQLHASPFQKGWLYRGTLTAFQSDNQQWRIHLPCSLAYYGKAVDRPRADADYVLTGQLRQRSSFDFTFKANSWEKIPSTWSLAEWRYSAKQHIHRVLTQHIHDPRTVAFLAALFTGDIENRMLQFEFGRIGLQYLLVISGFHFAILMAFVTFVLRSILPSRIKLWVLLSIICLYYLFVGNSPPVQRSFFAAAIFLAGQLLNRRASGLNILGACLLIETAIDPIIAMSVGFQLSFLSCFGIFLFHQPLRRFLSIFFPMRRFHETVKLPPLAQCAYILTSFFHRALCLTLAVNLALWPLLLAHFHRFPWLSLVYNLFTPGWTALSLFLLLLALTVYAAIPVLGLPLFQLAHLVSKNLLDLIANPPTLMDYGISSPFPGWALAPYIIFLLFAGIHLKPLTNLDSLK